MPRAVFGACPSYSSNRRSAGRYLSSRLKLVTTDTPVAGLWFCLPVPERLTPLRHSSGITAFWIHKPALPAGAGPGSIARRAPRQVWAHARKKSGAPARVRTRIPLLRPMHSLTPLRNPLVSHILDARRALDLMVRSPPQKRWPRRASGQEAEPPERAKGVPEGFPSRLRCLPAHH